ncbi:MAG TPA: ASCH domain-containing protein [Gemmatimonadaceae bacterium]|nr:ASCH domain-containing protein [Gemmatimonadaceae bacterium]
MRVLSIQQPFAQLVVRGVKRLEVRPWGTDYRGRIAIHASAAVVPRTIDRQWKEDREMALRFADQGWLEREDLKALPRSAIIGTAELVGVHLGKEVLHENTGLFAWNPATERMEVAERDARTGELRPRRSKQRPLPVGIPPDQYAWVFVEPVEIEPITGVDGQQKLWHLVGELEGVIADRERLSRRGWWRPSEVDPARRAKGIRAWRKQWESERERFARDVERRVLIRREVARIRFTPQVEEQLRNDLARYVKRNRVAKADGKEVHVRVESQFRQLFGGRDVVDVGEFELLLRRRLKKEGDAQYAARRRGKRKQALLELLDDLRKRAGRKAAEQDNIRQRLEAAADKMLEEEEEDYEFVRRELYPVGKEKAERAAARAAARAKAAREASAREAARKAARTPQQRKAEALVELIEMLWEMQGAR